jgi:iron complex outermembrane recepter protein
MRCSLLLVGALAPLIITAQTSAAEMLEEVVVTATLRSQQLINVPNSVTVLDSQVLKDAGQQHFEDVLGLVPNLNWAGGSSRPRFFQIRGIGEREQYEGAPNPSVGFLIDDIDFSGIGMAATLFDVKQIEVLRGPQGTRYGANALAGLIAVRSNDPEQQPHYGVDVSVGDYNTRSLGGYVTAPVESLNSMWRLSVQQYRSDGFMTDSYLHRKDTNNRDEFTGRFKWRWQVSDDSTIDFTVLHANLDNGYDGWAIDNSRTTLSDEPGKDSQRATGASVRYNSTAWNPYTLTVISTYVDSDSINSFDADWGNAQSWRPYTYAYFGRSDRDRKAGSLEVRLASPAVSNDQPLAWLVGVYALRTKENGKDFLIGDYAEPFYSSSVNETLKSDYTATNVALFTQLDGNFTERTHWSGGVRVEQRTSHYQDFGIWNGEPRPPASSARDRMLGMQLSLSQDVGKDSRAYVTLSRGYKAGGFNLGLLPDESKRFFKPEYLWSLESGIKGNYLDGRGYVDAAVFYERRRDLQSRTGEQLDPIGNPGSYTFVTTNIAHGYNAGVELSARYLLTPHWTLGGSLGLLRTRASGAIDENGDAVPTREQEHAPEYTASASVTWRAPQGWMARVDVVAKDNFYFDSPIDHNQQSHAYTIANFKVGYERTKWSAYAWINNAFDKDYAIRGFYFGNEPPNFDNKLYTQLGDPRTVGVTASWKY